MLSELCCNLASASQQKSKCVPCVNEANSVIQTPQNYPKSYSERPLSCNVILLFAGKVTESGSVISIQKAVQRQLVSSTMRMVQITSLIGLYIEQNSIYNYRTTLFNVFPTKISCAFLQNRFCSRS